MEMKIAQYEKRDTQEMIQPAKLAHKQQYLDEHRDALILYCQQFAFAPEMA